MQALAWTAQQYGCNPRLLDAVEAVNAAQKQHLFELMQRHFGGVRGKTVAVWGLSFKPNTDDMRAASSRIQPRTERFVEVLVPLDTGRLRLELVAPEGRWLVDAVDWEQE